jgi:CheY-like chemotaxis protein
VALLAGRILLLADDSLTIQKVVDLTFADEGVKVVAFGNGQEALDHLEEVAPDIVLADVFMPGMNGYQVCEFIKKNTHLNHIPVVLLVGSFEPFDEAEARRVGADDILTKPFQSIRRLIDKVGALMGDRAATLEMNTAEMPKPRPVPPESRPLDTQELNLVTADTKRFSDSDVTDHLPSPLRVSDRVPEISPAFAAERAITTSSWQEPVSTNLAERKMASQMSETQSELSGDVLLDLGTFEPAPSTGEAVLDLDFEEASAAASPATSAAAVPESEPVRAAERYDWSSLNEDQHRTRAVTAEKVEIPQTMDQPYSSPTSTSADHPPFVPGGQITLEQCSPELIDAIARRAVELMSEKVVQDVAWEVVPQLAELLIKRRLEETN